MYNLWELGGQRTNKLILAVLVSVYTLHRVLPYDINPNPLSTIIYLPLNQADRFCTITAVNRR